MTEPTNSRARPSSGTEEIEAQILDWPCDAQYEFARRVAANVGYVLAPEANIDPASRARPSSSTEAMREALEPFSRYANLLEGINWAPDGCPLACRPDQLDGAITVGDLRRAREALSASTPAPQAIESGASSNVYCKNKGVPCACLKYCADSTCGVRVKKSEIAPQEQSAIAPEGWQLVPKVPTIEICEALGELNVHRNGPSVAWRDALAAAPAPQEQSASGVRDDG